MEWDDRLEDDSLLIERILLLIRNILHVPANKQAEKRTDDDASIHDQVIWNLHSNGIDDLLLFIASSPDERRWSMHILEIVSLMLREQNPESLAKAGEGRSRTEKKDDERQLEIIRQQELAEKLNNARKFSGRHSRFGGTFYVQNMKSINDQNQLIYHRPLAEVKNMTFDHNKTAPKKRKKQLPAKEMGEERRSTLSIRLFLKNFCTEFLQNCYNPLMNIVKDNIKHGRSQENDETYFLWAMRFFMEFSRHHDFRVDYISETLSVVTFTDLLNIIIKFYDGLESNKSEAFIWGRRLHLAIQAYKELLMNVISMDNSEDDNLSENAKIIKGNIFYTPEYRDTFLSLLRKFNMSKQTKGYLRDLIEAFHIFLKMLEKYCAGKSHLVVQKKKKVSKKKKRNQHLAAPVNLTAEEIEQKWQELASDLSAILQGHAGEIPESAIPFDAASEVPVDEQKTNALSQVQGLLRNQLCGEAVALLRAARDVWADDDHFGSVGISAEDEFICLCDIFKMDLPSVGIPNENEEDEREEETNPEEEEMAAVQTSEVEFSIQDFLNKLATPSILRPYCWLLKHYKENKETTNHAIVKMLHRVAVDLKTPAMLFQLSLFCTFQKILSDPAANQYKEMVKFSRYIVAKFFELLPKNPVLLAELVVWKTSGDCYEIVEGYGSLALRSASQSASVWTFEEEEELRELYEQYKGSEDLVDTIMDKMSNDTKSRRQIMNKLVLMKLVTNRKELHKKPAKKGVWSEEEVEQLRALYEEYKNSEEEDVVERIMEHMLNASRTRRQVVNQLVNMGLVEDRKTLRKKKKKGNRKRKKDDRFVVVI